MTANKRIEVVEGIVDPEAGRELDLALAGCRVFSQHMAILPERPTQDRFERRRTGRDLEQTALNA